METVSMGSASANLRAVPHHSFPPHLLRHHPSSKPQTFSCRTNRKNLFNVILILYLLRYLVTENYPVNVLRVKYSYLPCVDCEKQKENPQLFSRSEILKKSLE